MLTVVPDSLESAAQDASGPSVSLLDELVREGARRMLAAALEAAVGGAPGETLLVASSDLSHYEPAPVAAELDAPVVASVAALDPESLQDLFEREPGHACGGGPLVAVMKAARALGADRAHVLRRADSGDEGPRDKSRVVGYLSAAFTAGR